MADVVLIRPGCTDFDDQKRIQGALDLPLNGRGQEQVAQLVQQLQGVPLEVVYAPPCEPARSTALAICEACSATFKEVAEFRNVDHGLWQGLQIDDARRKYPKVFKQWQECPESVCLPEGEPFSEAVERLRTALPKRIKRKKSVGIVASEPLATLIACLLRGCPSNRPLSVCNQQPERQIEFFRNIGPDLPPMQSPLAFRAAVKSDAPKTARTNGNGAPPPSDGNGRALGNGSSEGKNGSVPPRAAGTKDLR